MKIETDDFDEAVVALDTYNSDLNLVIDAARYSAKPLTTEGFAFMWAGVRATHGSLKGKFCFEVKILDQLDVSHLPADEPNPHVVRVGFSVESSTMQLGEDPLSYGYGGTGKISTNCQFKDFGGPFTAGDVILGAVNADSDQVQIGFAKNGKFLGWAYRVGRNELKGQALFPHVLTKNVSFEVNLGQKEKPYFPLPDTLKDFTFIGSIPMPQRVGGTRAPKRREDCEMIMMCGLPGAGKSVWAADYSLKNPKKKFNVLGTNNIIDKMKVMGLPRKRNYHGRWDVLIQMATKCLNKMFEIGSKLKRNYILDQTNVYPTAQRRKMRNFEGFLRKAVVVVPSDSEYKRRCDKRDKEEGKEVPDHAVLEMKANFKLPEVNDIFNEVVYTELQKEDAEKLIIQYNDEGKAAVGPPRKQFKSSDGSGSRFDSGRDRDNRSSPGFPPRGDFDGRDRGRGGFEGRGRGGFEGRGRGGFGRGGFEGGRGGFDRNRGGFEGGRGGFGGGFDRNRGGFEGGRGGFEGGRGGFDRNRGGFEGGRGGFEGGRGGFDRNRGGFEGGRGGFDRNRGGFDRNRGGFEGRGGFDGGRGEFDGGRGGFDGGFEGGRGGYDEGVRGGFGGGRGGFEGSRGGFDRSRGGFEGGRGGFDRNRGGFDGGRGGFDKNKGGFEGGRDDFDGNRGGFERGRGGSDRGNRGGGFDRNRGGRFDNGQGDNEADYGNNDGGFGGRGGFNNSRGGFDRKRKFEDDRSQGSRGSPGGYGGGSPGGNNVRGGSRGGDYSRGGRSQSDQDSYSGGGRDFNSGSNSRGGYRGSSSNSSRGGSGGYGASSNSSRGGSGGNYGASSYDQDQSAGRYGDKQGYSSSGRDSSPYGGRSIKKEPSSSGYGSGDGARNTRASGRASRWSTAAASDSPQEVSSYSASSIPAKTSYSSYAPQIKTEPVDNTSAYGYSSYTPQVKAEPVDNSAQYGYDSYSSNTQSYSSYVPPSQPTQQGYQTTSQQQSYGYQSTVPAANQATPQAWSQPAPAAAAPAPTAQATNEQQWAQYYQQQQYYNQYYGQQPQAQGAATTTYGAYGAK